MQEGWILVPLAYGFVARVVAGPRFSPLARFVTGVVTPRLPIRHRFVPGPPKRFAQGIGVVFSSGAVVAWWASWAPVALTLIAGLTVAATLEAALGLCLGCVVFGRLMWWGVIPESVCVACADLSARLPLAAAPANRRGQATTGSAG